MKPLVRLHRVHTFNKIGKLDTFYQKIFLHIVEHHHSKENMNRARKKLEHMPAYEYINIINIRWS